MTRQQVPSTPDAVPYWVSDCKKVNDAVDNLALVLAEVRGQQGRDYIRRLRFGEILDQLDAEYQSMMRGP